MLSVGGATRFASLAALTTIALFEGGQSNEEGRATPVGQAVVPDVLVHEAYNATALVTPMSPAPFVGPRIQLCRNLLALGRHCAVGRYAHGGSLLDEWQAGQPFNTELREGSARMVGLLRAALAPRHLTIKPNFQWGHGESDAQDLGRANAYESGLTTFLDGMDQYWTTIFGAPIPTTIIGLNPGFLACPFRATVIAAQQAVAALQPWRVFVSTAAIVGPFDADVHYTQAQQIQLGGILAPVVAAAS